MPKFQAVPQDTLKAGLKSSGVVRDVAFNGEGIAVLRSRVEPGTISGWHHHGDYDVYGYVVSGTSRFESGPDGKDVIEIGPGGFFSVPAHTIHREVNPSSTEGGEVVLFLKGDGQTVFNVEGPAQS
jgi:quercetin dioxygenase-like cupin family protein